MRTKIEEQVLQALGAAVPAAKTVEIDPSVLIRDQVDLDSMAYLDFVLALQRRFSVRIPPTSYPMLATLEGAVECIEQLLGAASEGTPSAPGRR